MLVAVTVYEPAACPAVYNPEELIVPPVAAQVTATFDVNCCVPPVSSVMFVGEIVTPVAGTETVTLAVADLVVSCTLVAVTVKEPAVAPAVKRPVEVTVPPVAAQVTAGFDALL